MTTTDAYALQHSDLNGFLFAAVGKEAGGMTLSVLSVLARLEMDPWQEAGRLANLPATVAIAGLARLIATMPTSPWSLPDATIIAERLVALLPARRSGAAPPVPSAPVDRKHALRWIMTIVLVAAVLTALASTLVGQRAPTPDNGSLSSWPSSPTAPAARTSAVGAPNVE